MTSTIWELATFFFGSVSYVSSIVVAILALAEAEEEGKVKIDFWTFLPVISGIISIWCFSHISH